MGVFKQSRFFQLCLTCSDQSPDYNNNASPHDPLASATPTCRLASAAASAAFGASAASGPSGAASALVAACTPLVASARRHTVTRGKGAEEAKKHQDTREETCVNPSWDSRGKKVVGHK